MRTIVAALAFSTSIAQAGVLSPEMRADLAQKVLAGFWGSASDSFGNPILPKDDQDRKTVPVSPEVVSQALDAGEVAGLAKWCQLDWKPRYHALTRAARDEKLVDKQVAFVSFLHGAAQQTIATAMERKPCSESDRNQVRHALSRPPLVSR
jgi:hypothetical protein